MNWEDSEPRRAQPDLVVGEDLSKLAVTELEARVTRLAAEIARIEQEIAAKRRHSAAASSLFKN